MSPDDPAPSAASTAPSDPEPVRAADIQEDVAEPLSTAATAGGASVDPADEEDLWVGRTSWKHYTGRLALWLLANAFFAGFVIWLAPRWEWLDFWRGVTMVAAVFVLSGLEFAGRRVLLRIIDHRYRLTTQRLFIERGILNRTIDQTELIRVDDVRLHKTLFDRIMGLGSVTIVSTDATDQETLLEGIYEPEKVAEAIRTHMRTLRRKSLFIENL